MIEECVLGYRTVGELDASGSNTVLLSTWGFATSEHKLASDLYVGPEGWVDPQRYFAIVVDAFGNGVSSSPSNSRTQPGAAFPEFSFGDLVHAQYRLVTEVLGLERLHAVAGISMGGEGGSGGGFAEETRARPPARDRGQEDPAGMQARVRREGARDARAVHTGADDAHAGAPKPDARPRGRSGVPRGDAPVCPGHSCNRRPPAQLRAAERVDVTEPFGGALERAAGAVRAEMLIVVNTHDLMTTPEPSRAFAALAGARLLETADDCGHQTFLPQCRVRRSAPRSGTS